MKAAEYGIDEIVTLLERLSEDTDATQETRGDAFSTSGSKDGLSGSTS